LKKQDGVIFKVDFKKAYDKVKWSFLQQTLRMKGFSQKIVQMGGALHARGKCYIKVNDQLEVHTFKQEKAYGRVTQCHQYYLI
jgi:hypothetical protein